jgi:hypothetical protein
MLSGVREYLMVTESNLAWLGEMGVSLFGLRFRIQFDSTGSRLKNSGDRAESSLRKRVSSWHLGAK